MKHRHGMALVAAFATLLATMPLASIFASWLWLFNAIVAIAAVVGAATAVRALHGPAGVQVLAGMAALLLVLTWRFPSGHEIAWLIPSADTFRHFTDLLQASGEQIRNSAVPVPNLEGLLLLATAGIGLVAVLVDLAAVGIRRPALAGLPMLALYSVPVAVLPKGLSFIYFAFACAGFLWLLVSDSVDRVRRFGRRFSGEGRDVDVWEPSPLSAAGRRLGVVAVVVAIVLPLAVPAMTPMLLSRFGPEGNPNGSGGNGGNADTLDMNALLEDNLKLDDPFEMLVVHTNDPDPYYLRIGVAEQVDEDGFHSQLPEGLGVPFSQPLPNRFPTAPVATVGTYTAQIEIKALSVRLAPAYSVLVGLQGLDGSWTLDMNTDEVYSQGMSINHSVYTADYTRLAFAPDDLRKAGPISPTDTGARALTAVPYSDYVASVVSGLISGKGNEYDRVLALYDYFSSDNGFRYSLVTTEGNSGSAIVDFLENKKGFCVQYAAALAWLVRQAGYPARVAFGYTRGTQVQDGVYSMSSQNLHAWTEVYFPDFGWVPFDATPGTSVPGSTRTIWAPDVEKTGQGQNTSAPPVQATGAPQTVDPGAGGNTNSGGSDNGGLSISINPWYVVAGALVLLLLVLLAAPSVQRRVRRRRRLASSGGLIALTPPPPGTEYLVTDPDAMTAVQRDAHNAWAELLDTMIDYGVLVDPAETPRGTVGRLAATPQLSISGRAPTAVLGRAEERARYAPSPIRVVNLDDAVREARRAFAEDASRWQQFTAWLFPRSVLLHWRLSWYGFLARSVRRVARTRDALLLVEFRERRRGN